MQNYIKNKTALITGASSGIGEACALSLASMGVNLILTARDKNNLIDLKNKLEKHNITIQILSLDVRNKDDVENKLKDLDVDILINNAGLALGLEPFEKGDIEQWDTMIDTNIKGLLYVSKAIIPNMRDKQTAHIINLGSVAGKTAYPNGAVYCATKSAVHSLGEALNADMFGTNVKVTTIAPGAVETNFSKIRFSGDEQKANKVYEGYTPLVASDISNAIVNVLNTPPHVNIQYLDIMPTAQRNPYMVFKV
jgi:NADP-dependent 3-hydroxy acid dehydrogenase YdfG